MNESQLAPNVIEVELIGGIANGQKLSVREHTPYIKIARPPDTRKVIPSARLDDLKKPLEFTCDVYERNDNLTYHYITTTSIEDARYG